MAREMTAHELAELERRVESTGRLISTGTWVIAAGMILYSMLTATPFVADHTPPGKWQYSAPVLPIVVDMSFVISLRVDALLGTVGSGGGLAAWLLRAATGAASVFLNIWGSVERHDPTGVALHLIPPLLLILAAEAGPAYRRRLARQIADARARRRLTVEREERERRAAKERERREAEEKRERERRAVEEREEREEQRAAARRREEREHELEMRRLAVASEQQRPASVAPAPVAAEQRPAPAARNELPAHQEQRPVVVPRVQEQRPAPAPAPALAPRPEPERRPAAPVSAAQGARPAVTARIEEPEREPERVADWELPDLPQDCAPGQPPHLITDSQAMARIRYGHSKGWVQRRIAVFADRSPSTVHKHVRLLASAN
ncbi:helix-turn-helix domain-containing protein [Streptomyces sp. NBS 14/10]|uniref:helix-turn-helix domain-containing protein n=1 Tax=Streptomyces sp. NBS 14/10 TaxID=1945643 RepID=UPI000B7DBB49|nr:helix-turn-helix domain-containing protein [Streptomyces sp. NBS 14/10]KAK1176696.1 helix-turn-helix domain-containing protein [Streptomyces sp. NBS 14/10]